jgi:hypothetical protein
MEFKRYTGLLPTGCDTLCAFLNGQGGTVLFGVSDSGRIVGQHYSDASRLAPNYSLKGGCFVVTFPLWAEPESRPESELARGILEVLQNGPLGKADIAMTLGHRSISPSLNRTIRQLLSDGRIAFTLPENPNSRLQKYRLLPTQSLDRNS